MGTLLTELGDSAVECWKGRSPRVEEELAALCAVLVQTEAALTDVKRELPADAFNEATGQCEVGSLAVLLGIPAVCVDSARRILELAVFSLELETNPISTPTGLVTEADWRTGAPLFGFTKAVGEFFKRYASADVAPFDKTTVLATFGECCKFVHSNPVAWEFARKGAGLAATKSEVDAAVDLLGRCVRHAVYLVLATGSSLSIEAAPRLFDVNWPQVERVLGLR